MRFVCKEAKHNVIDISAKTIIDRSQTDDYSISRQRSHNPVLRIMLNASESNIIRSDYECGSLEMHIVPHREILIKHYKENKQTGTLTETTIPYTDLSESDSALLFDFADFINECCFSQTGSR